ncbi:MAG: tetratricopeptide repeat protein [Planctomycetota bacterium]
MEDPASGTEPEFVSLLARALEAVSVDGSDGLGALLEAHPAHADRLRRAVARLREVGLAAADPAEGAPLAVPERVGPFRIFGVLGVGGMGAVFLAARQHPARAVALKVLRGGRTREALRRFEFETEVLGRLHHPHIAKVYEAGTDHDADGGPVPYFAMEYVPGAQPITAFVGRQDQPLEARLAVMIKICDAMEHAHQRGIVHRDVKPSNVLIDEDGEPKVIDFGVARATGVDVALTSRHTGLGHWIGTLQYMSPEQSRGESGNVDTRSDVYALGLLLYEVTTGTLPYEVAGVPVPEAIERICHTPPRRPSAVSTRLRGDLETIILMALAKEPERRYGSAGALANDLRPYQQSRPIDARPPSARYALRMFAKRHRATVTALAAAGLVLVIGAVVAGWLAVEEAWQRQRAEAREADLARVVRFQTAMLRDLDLAGLGAFLGEDLRTRLAAGLDREGPDEADAAAVSQGMEAALERVNIVDTARALLHEKVLDRATTTLGEEFGDEPALAATLRLHLAAGYRALGDDAAARDHLEQSLAVRQSLFGNQSREAMEAAHQLGAALDELGDFPQAEEHLRAVVRWREQELGSQHPETLDACTALGAVRLSQGAADEAGQLFQRALTGLGPMNAQNVQVQLQLADALRAQDAIPAALEHARTAAATAEAALGPDHRTTLAARQTLAGILDEAGSWDEAEALQRETIERLAARLGDQHPTTLVALAQLARSLLLNRTQGGSEAERAYAGLRRVLGPGHPETLRALWGRCRRLPPGEKHVACVRELLRGYKLRYGTQHSNVFGAMQMLGNALQGAKRLAEAEPVLREARAGRIAMGQPVDHHDVAAVTNDLGTVLVLLDRADEAEPLLREALAGIERARGPDHWHTGVVLTTLGQTLHRLGSPEAEAHLRRGYRLLRAGLGPTQKTALVSLDALAAWCADHGHAPEALELIVDWQDRVAATELSDERRAWVDEQLEDLRARHAPQAR